MTLPITPPTATRRRTRRLPPRLLLWALALAMALAAIPPHRAEAQARSLHWPRIEVRAHLDADGRLHVRERQRMQLSGDWNGGERRFDLGPGQRLTVEEIVRIDLGRPASTREIELRQVTRGDTLAVDEWRRFADDVVRWRSRDPADPPFDGDTRVYQIEYTLTGAVQRTSPGRYRMRREFGFPNRPGPIDTLALELTLDPAWRLATATEDSSLRWTWRGLQPGVSPETRLDLEHVGAGRPAAVFTPLTLAHRWIPYGAALAAMVLLILAFVRDERRSPRFRRLSDPQVTPSRAWLQEHVFRRPAEEVGALWDRAVGGPEVAAMLARLVVEGKLESHLEPPAGSPERPPVLHLELRVPHGSLTAAESDLLAGLLLAKEGDTTSTERVRAHYAGKGFDPAARIRPPLRHALPEVKRARDLHPPWRRWLTPALLLAAYLLFVVGFAADLPATVLGAGFASVAGAAYLFAVVAARMWRTQVNWRLSATAWFLVPPLAALAATAVGNALLFPALGAPNPGLALFPALLASALLPLAALSSALYQGRLAEVGDTVLARRRLRHARDHFEAELSRPEPDLEDAWLPYLLALGLHPKIEGWEERWGVAPAARTGRAYGSGTSFGAGRSSSSSGPGRAWSGGGGAFGGGGASSAWSTAASSLARGVAAPSSSRGGSGGGGGGGGGGGSSSGGGGGGW